MYRIAAHTKGRNRRGKQFTTSFGEICSFICGHIYLCKQLLPQINSCCQVVMKNNEDCRMLVASRKATNR